ncbi:hypothetical protein K443DRAFT_670640, partial [Laccaria amethystina LaAM-08-1]
HVPCRKTYLQDQLESGVYGHKKMQALIGSVKKVGYVWSSTTSTMSISSVNSESNAHHHKQSEWCL